MNTRLIDGRTRAARLCAEVADAVADLTRTTGVQPVLAVVLVGEDPASTIYVAAKIRQAGEVGMQSRTYRLPATATEAEVLALIATLNTDQTVHGLLVQLPLPPQIDRARVIAAIAPAKDVDGFHESNVGRLANGADGVVPCTPLGCMMLLKEEFSDLSGKVAAVIGCSTIVGRPMVQLLLREDCTVLVGHRHTIDLPALVGAAEILVVAAGVPGLIRGDWLRPGAVVIDVGINRVSGTEGKTRITGDVAFDEALGRAAAITPVPGGVGPMTIACLLANTLSACRNQIGGQAVPA